MEDLAQSLGLGALIVLALVLIALFGVAVYLLVKLIRMFSLVRSEAMPVSGKVAFWAALAYTVLPLDVLPDPIFLDDIGVLGAALAFLGHLAAKSGVTPDGDRAEAIDLDEAERPRSSKLGTRPTLDG